MTTDHGQDRPAWRQIADDLRAGILAGRWPPGAKLPSESDLMGQHEVGRKTVRLAYDLLRAEGRVTSVKARGYFVREQVVVRRLAYDLTERGGMRGWGAAIERAGLRPMVRVTVGEVSAPPRIAEGLGVEPGTVVLARSRIMGASGGPPDQLATSFIPLDVAERAPRLADTDTGPGGMLDLLEDAGYGPLHFDEIVTARHPSPDETAALALAQGVPVLVVCRLTWSAADELLDYQERVVAADRCELAYRFGEFPPGG